MERFNLRSGSLVNPDVSSSSRIQGSGRTEGNRLTDFAAGDAVSLASPLRGTPQFNGIWGNFVPLQNP